MIRNSQFLSPLTVAVPGCHGEGVGVVFGVFSGMGEGEDDTVEVSIRGGGVRRGKEKDQGKEKEKEKEKLLDMIRQRLSHLPQRLPSLR